AVRGALGRGAAGTDGLSVGQRAEAAAAVRVVHAEVAALLAERARPAEAFRTETGAAIGSRGAGVVQRVTARVERRAGATAARLAAALAIGDAGRVVCRARAEVADAVRTGGRAAIGPRHARRADRTGVGTARHARARARRRGRRAARAG